MKLLKKTAVTLTTAAALAFAGSANAFLTDWTLDTNGGAAGGQVSVAEYLDIVGQSYIHNTFSSPSNFTFQDAGKFVAATADGFMPLPNAIHTTFTATGSGSVSLSGGSLTFSTGTLNVFSSTNLLIGTFALIGGSGALLPNSVLPNGELSLSFLATYLAPGYFFKDVTDLSSEVAGGLVFGFATTNASLVTGANAIGSALANVGPLYTATFGTLPTTTNYGSENLVVGNNGQYRLQVPEPVSLTLTGIALLGLGATTRRRKEAA